MLQVMQHFLVPGVKHLWTHLARVCPSDPPFIEILVDNSSKNVLICILSLKSEEKNLWVFLDPEKMDFLVDVMVATEVSVFGYRIRVQKKEKWN